MICSSVIFFFPPHPRLPVDCSLTGPDCLSVASSNEQISRNPRRVAHCRVSSLVMVCRRSFAAKANLLAIETALLARRQQSADHNQDKVCQVGVTVNTEYE